MPNFQFPQMFDVLERPNRKKNPISPTAEAKRRKSQKTAKLSRRANRTNKLTSNLVKAKRKARRK